MNIGTMKIENTLHTLEHNIIQFFKMITFINREKFTDFEYTVLGNVVLKSTVGVC
jgi:hypothetical protein